MKKKLCILMLALAALLIIPTAANASAVDSGKFGDNLEWIFDDSGTLTISGDGDMPEIYGMDGVPWRKWCYEVTSVIIDDGVSSIGEFAFYEFMNLKSITIPDSVLSIRRMSFEFCTSLTDITIPSSVTNIDAAFSCCGMLRLDVSPQNEFYSSSDGVLFNKDMTEIVAYTKDYLENEYTIPDGVTSVGDYAFHHNFYLTGVTIPDSVTSIGNAAFENCYYLADITMPDSIISIGDWAFSWCRDLADIKLPRNLTHIGESAFSHCDSFTSIVIPEGVTSIVRRAFYECAKLTSITIPNSVTHIADYAVFGCYDLTDVYYNGSEQEWNKIDIGYFNDFRYAEIHYINRTSSSSVEKCDNIIKITTSLDSLSEEDKQISRVCTALYDENDAVLDCCIADYEGTDVTGTLVNSENADHIRVFVWNMDGSLAPLTETPEYIEL